MKMVTRILPAISLCAAALITAAPAFAHPRHDGTDRFWRNVAHIFTSADHLVTLAIVAAAVGAGAYAWSFLRKRRARHARRAPGLIPTSRFE